MRLRAQAPMTMLWIQYGQSSQPSGHSKIAAAISVTPSATVRLRADDRANDRAGRDARTAAMKRCVIE